MSDQIRVLIAEDSPTLRKYIRATLESDPSFTVVGEAINGEEAISLCRSLDPDIITMDIQMPKMDGLTAIAKIMAEMPRPIVVMTSTKSNIETGSSFKAMEAGALMVMSKPRAMPAVSSNAENIISQVKTMAQVKVVGRRRSINKDATYQSGAKSGRIEINRGAYEVITIGTSTGGPAAVQMILNNLPADLPVPVLIVQHLSNGFITGLAKWLDESTPLNVRVAGNGDLIQPGVAYLAPDDRHMTIGTSFRIQLLDSPNIDRHKPSVTALFTSVAERFGEAAIGVLLTGMGSDGARGLKAIRDAGGYTFAQEKDSCVVFGMPNEAIKLDAVREVLSVEDVAPRILSKLRR